MARTHQHFLFVAYLHCARLLARLRVVCLPVCVPKYILQASKGKAVQSIFFFAPANSWFSAYDRPRQAYLFLIFKIIIIIDLIMSLSFQSLSVPFELISLSATPVCHAYCTCTIRHFLFSN